MNDDLESCGQHLCASCFEPLPKTHKYNVKFCEKCALGALENAYIRLIKAYSIAADAAGIRSAQGAVEAMCELDKAKVPFQNGDTLCSRVRTLVYDRDETRKQLEQFTQAEVYDQSRLKPASDEARYLWAKITDKPHWALPTIQCALDMAPEDVKQAAKAVEQTNPHAREYPVLVARLLKLIL